MGGPGWRFVGAVREFLETTVKSVVKMVDRVVDTLVEKVADKWDGGGLEFGEDVERGLIFSRQRRGTGSEPPSNVVNEHPPR